MKKNYLMPKFFEDVKNYNASRFVKDITAGVIVAIIALPLSIALALASGVEPAAGVYTAIFAGFFVALLGGSSVQIAGPTAAFATVVAGIVATQGMDGLIIATILAGVFLILMGVLKLGSLVKFIPTTITVGFTAGIAVTIFVGQIKDFLGLTYQNGVRPIETIEKITANIEAIGTFSLKALLIGVISLLILIVYPKFEKKVPPSLIAVIVSALLVNLIPSLNEGVYTIGELYTIPAGLPKLSVIGMDFSMDKVVAVLPSAFTIAILAAIESLLSCVVADSMINGRHNPNAELVAQGVGNITSVLFGGIAATGAIARTAANVKNGGNSGVSGMVHSVVLLIVLIFLMPYAALIPMPTIAAILFMVAFNMSEYKKFMKILKTAPKSDIIVLVLTFLLTVVFDLVVAIEVGMILVAVLFIRRMSEVTDVKIFDHTDLNDIPNGTVVCELSGPMFFGISDKIRNIELSENVNTVILRLNSVSALDSSCMQALESFYDKLKENDIRLILTHINKQPLKVMNKAGFIEKIGENNIYEHFAKALKSIN